MKDSKHTYVIDTTNDTISTAEVVRLDTQDRIVTSRMPLLPFPLSPEQSCDILDLACGTAGWGLRVVKTYPRVHLTGIDVNKQTLEFARAQAETQELSKRVKFIPASILEPLPFSDNAFDFVNARFLTGVLNRETWTPFMDECFRVCKPGGSVRITEGTTTNVAMSPVQHRVNQIIMQAAWHGRRGFAETEVATCAMVEKFVTDAGFIHAEEFAYALNYSAGKPLHDLVTKDFTMTVLLLKSFFAKFAGISEQEVEDLYQQMCEEMNAPDFRAIWYVYSVVAQKPA